MCTVVTQWRPDRPVHILALRDEQVGREFDDPDEWWPGQPGVVGGRDQHAGGSWCVTDIAAGVTALVLNRTERHHGSPSRGLLPLAAVAHGPAWTQQLDHRTMASFTLVLVAPTGVTTWEWDARELRRRDLDPGQHMMTPWGVDADDPRQRRFAGEFAGRPWIDVVTGQRPDDADDALVVRRERADHVYATVFGQLIETVPGRLRLRSTRTPWQASAWHEREWRAGQTARTSTGGPTEVP